MRNVYLYNTANKPILISKDTFYPWSHNSCDWDFLSKDEGSWNNQASGHTLLPKVYRYMNYFDLHK